MNKDEIQNLIKEIIEKMDISVKEILISQEDNSKTVWYSVAVSEPYFFTSRSGEALSSLNHLVRRILENKTTPIPEVRDSPTSGIGEQTSVLIDIGDFQRKRVDSIKAIAHMMAERARYFKANIEIDPMSSFDRRIVHEFLSNATDLKTESSGVGPSRRVVIKYTGN